MAISKCMNIFMALNGNNILMFNNKETISKQFWKDDRASTAIFYNISGIRRSPPHNEHITEVA